MWANFVETAFLIALFINAIFFLPQIFKLIKEKHDCNLSLTTFAGLNLFYLVWSLHSWLAGDMLLMLGCACCCAANTVVTFLLIKYRFFAKTNSLAS